MVGLARPAQLDLLDYLAIMALPDRMAPPDLADPTAPQAPLEHKDFQDLEGLLVFPETMVQLDLMDAQEQPVLKDLTDQLDPQGHLEHLDPQDEMAQLALLASLAPQDLQGPQDLLVHQDLMERMAHPVHKGREEQPAAQEVQVLPGPTDLQDPPDLAEILAPLDHMDLADHQDLTDQPDLLDFQV